MGWEVLLPQELKKDTRDLLENHGHTLIDGRRFETEDVIADMKEHEPDATIVRITEIPRAVFEAVIPNLKALIRHGAGYDVVDLKAAANYGAKCPYAPVVDNISVTETTLMLMLYMSGNVTRLHDMSTVDFYDAKLKAYMTTLSGKTVGLIECGNIGSRTAKRYLAMEMSVLYYDPYEPICDFPEGVEVIRDIERISRESDYVSLHTSNTPVIRNMINEETLSMMKPTVFLINATRDAMVNGQDLYEACKNHVIAGTVLDAVVYGPILPDMPLVTLDNVLITPHVDGNTVEAAMRTSYTAAVGIMEIYEEKEPIWPTPDTDYETASVYTNTTKLDRKPVGMYGH